ncbi:MAG TPA: glucoamylase family protein [Flavisolibacter sp.]|nr:glucoamylase family protein [Flavisolibacter sp.]
MKPIILLLFSAGIWACHKNNAGGSAPPPAPEVFRIESSTVNGASGTAVNYGVATTPKISILLSAPVNRATANSILFNTAAGVAIPYNLSFEKNDSVVNLQPATPLPFLTKFNVAVSTALQSKSNKSLENSATITFITSIDSADKFARISDTALVELVQKQTFRYFWEFGHPVSGLARERNTSGDVVTSGGSGFGIMAIITGISRNFISRAEGLQRLQTMVGFLKNSAETFHGAFPHWLNGATGKTVPFSTKDNGADLVETSFLMQGLLCARQYFNGADAAESTLRADINSLWNAVEWSWFRKNNENVLYWHWSRDYQWDMNLPVRGWNECLVTYVLAASSPSYSIPKIVYESGWAQNGGMKNGNIYFGYPLPLGPVLGGPLFFAHYSFLGLNPFGLTDQYADYQVQVVNHTKINYEYCRANPRNYYGYSDQCWGLTASDIPNGYTASSPTNDIGVIAPTAALSSFPYTPAESMNALRFFYYKLGDKLWGPHGFYDAFSLHDQWFASSYLAIDQGPIVVMLENYRTGLLWKLLMSCPEVKSGLTKLGFQSPNI